MPELMNLVGGLAPAAVIGLFALPSYLGVLKQKGLLRGLLILLALGAVVIGINASAIKSDLPHQNFAYADLLGHKLLGATPWSIGAVYSALILTAFWLASKLVKNHGRLALVMILMLLFGLVFSPALFQLGLWRADNVELLFGVPLTSFATLAMISLVGGWLLNRLWGKHKPVGGSVAYSGLAMLFFWSGVNVSTRQWLSLGAGILIGLALITALLAERRAPKSDHFRKI
jgi:uncharacterized membrane protein